MTLGGVCIILLHLAARASDLPAKVYLRQTSISLVAEVNRPQNAELVNARAFVAFDNRGVYVAETPEQVLSRPCVDGRERREGE